MLSFCAGGIDIPVISKAVGGQTIGTLLSALPGYLTGMGNVVANGKKVGVLVNIGSNNIELTDYDAMAPVTRDAMLANLNSIIDQIEAAGMIPILASVHSRSGAAAIYEEWADKMYRPLIQSRCAKWFKGGLAAFDYCRLYTTNDSTANWYQADGSAPKCGHRLLPRVQRSAAESICQVQTSPHQGALFVCLAYIYGIHWRNQSDCWGCYWNICRLALYEMSMPLSIRTHL